MVKLTEHSDGDNSLELKSGTETMPKIEDFDYNFPSDNMYSRQIGDNAASTSGSNLRSSFIGMGFSPSLVDKVIEENGEDNIDLLLDTLFAYSAIHKSKLESSDSVGGLISEKKTKLVADCHPEEALHKSYSDSSDSLDSLFGDEKDTSSNANTATDIQPKEEPDICSGVIDEKKTSLLMMNFSLVEVEFAIEKLGEDAPISDLVDFIFAAQMAKNCEKDVDDSNHVYEGTNEPSNTEALFGTMEKTLRLLEMGFSENEISVAIEKYGVNVPISELAAAIVAYQSYGTCSGMEKGYHSFEAVTVKTEEYAPDALSQFRYADLMEKYKGKRPREEYINEISSLQWPKQEPGDDSSACFTTSLPEPRRRDSNSNRFRTRERQLHGKAGQLDGYEMPKLSMPSSCKSLDQMVAKAPYFFFGNVTNLSHNSWVKISQFLYAIEPEFVNTQLFSALNRKEGYVHNLPTENRDHILPKSPMSIEEAMPHTKKYWPSWDTRKQLSCISSETAGISDLCDSLAKILVNSGGLLSVEQQRDLLHQCLTLNLVWVGRNRLAPMEPEHLELILGYPLHHTQIDGFSLTERLQSLKHCFQTDTLGYHLSVLKSLFPAGLRVLSIYSGIGGAEISLHRLGIHLKAVVSVEPSETKQRILRRWWYDSGQGGELVQIEDIHRLASSKLEGLIKKFGGFDFVICQNPHISSSKRPMMAAYSDNFGGLDFSRFYEFVRVLQRVRSTMERN